MNYRYSIFIISLIILSSAYSSYGEKIELHPNNTVIYVNSYNTEGPWHGTKEYPYQYIQDGINNSIEGNIIFVLKGLEYLNGQQSTTTDNMILFCFFGEL